MSTELDEQSFTQINEIKGILLIDNSSGWSVEARTGGRPFLCFDTITIDGAPVAVDPNEVPNSLETMQRRDSQA